MACSWIKKYEPFLLEDIKGQPSIKRLNEFITGYRTQKKKAAILYGPSGCGKTSSVIAMAEHHNLEIVEVNASDFRNKEQIELRVGNAMKQRSLFFKKKIILIDDINGLSGAKDRGGVSAIAKLLSASIFPVVMTADDPWNSKFSSLRSKSLILEFQPLGFEEIYNTLKTICEKEKVWYEDKALKILARSTGGDLRAAINDLQVFSCEKRFASEEIGILPERDKTESIHNALTKIFKGSDIKTALSAFDNINEDIQKSMLWLDENISYEYFSADLAKAYDALSRADVFLGRIRRQQHWRFLVYAIALSTAGVCACKSVKNKRFIPYKPTSRILKLWKAKMRYQRRKAIAEKIALTTHCSVKTALQDSVPYIKSIFENNPEEAEVLAQNLNLDEEEVNWLQN